MERCWDGDPSKRPRFKAKFIDNNKAELIKSVSEVMAIVDKLGNMVQSETYSVIKAQRTSQDKVRVLLQRTLHSGGAKVKAAFYDILKTDQKAQTKGKHTAKRSLS
uniref:CARD domain-containing protein n=1 Tax=Mastacembelus armatus TaxID=205130 RepID=A0A7N8XM57_9TELE